MDNTPRPLISLKVYEDNIKQMRALKKAHGFKNMYDVFDFILKNGESSLKLLEATRQAQELLEDALK